MANCLIVLETGLTGLTGKHAFSSLFCCLCSTLLFSFQNMEQTTVVFYVYIIKQLKNVAVSLRLHADLDGSQYPF